MNSLDRAEISVLRRNSLTISQLAPYDRWSPFRERGNGDWLALTKSVDRLHVSRVAVRFINRLDIPILNEIVKAEEYLTVYAHLPEDIGDNHRITDYIMQLHRSVGEKCRLIINTASALSPLPNHAAFLLDIEVYEDVSIKPLSDAKIWAKLDEMRNHKNHMFEKLITAKARALFN